MLVRLVRVAGTVAALILAVSGSAEAVWWGTYGTWDSQARKDAADASMRAVVNRFNAYGDFNWGNDGWVDVYYKPGVPTAQANYYGSIDFGGTWPNERVTQHEINHWFGTGTYWNWANQFSSGVLTGARVNTLIRQFDGDTAVIRQAGYHFYPYGLNYDSEVTDAATFMRNVALTYAMRQDMGNGNPANPWAATRVTLTGSDPLGTSAFNWYGGGWSGASYPGWDDNYVPHAGAAYFTSDYLLRTPLNSSNPGAVTPSFTFGGTSLTVNNTNGISGGLLFKGVGATGTVTIPNLILDGGYVRHASSSGDLFQLAGNVILRNAPTIDAAQGNIRVVGPIAGPGSLTKRGRFSLTLAAAQNTYTGGTIVQAGTLVLAGANGSAGPTTVQAGTLRVAHAAALAASAVTVEAGGRLEVTDGLTMRAASVHLSGGTLAAGSLVVGRAGIGSLTLAGGQLAGGTAVQIGAGGVMELTDGGREIVGLSGLSVDQAAGGRLDLGAGELTVMAGGITAAALRADIIAGRAGGGWTGSGIGSTLVAASGGTRAVGYLIAADGRARVSFAAPGDIDLDGVVNVFDLVGINGAGAYGSGAAADWATGDANYDGVTNVFDLVGINTAGAYGRGDYYPAETQAAVTAVPEPPAGIATVAALIALTWARGRAATCPRGQ